MKKFIIGFGLVVSAVVVGYSLTTTMADIFAVGRDSTGGPLVRMDSTGQVITDAGFTAGTNSTFTGTTLHTGVATFTATPSFTTLVPPTADVTVTTPTVIGQIVKTSTYELYIATATTGIAAWAKVGGQ